VGKGSAVVVGNSEGLSTVKNLCIMVTSWDKEGEGHHRRERGLVKLLLLAGILLTIFATATQVIPIFYRSYEIESQMNALATKYPEITTEQIKNRLIFELTLQQIPAKDDALRVYIDGDYLVVSLQYIEELAFRFRNKRYVLHTFKFSPLVKKYALGG
jgi:hypothetical protein